MDYTIEVHPISKAGWSYPSEVQGIWGKPYSRDGITIHWWGDGTGASNHDNIVNYLSGKAAAGTGPDSNYVLSDAKITLLVNPDDVAWCSGPGNPSTISVETQPTLGDEGYKKMGWLIWQLRQRYGKYLPLYPHKYWQQTDCPGTLSLDRMEQEAQKWANGGYNPAPAQPEWLANLQPITPSTMYTQDQAPLVDVSNGNVIKRFAVDTPIDVAGKTTYQGGSYILSAYSFAKKLSNAIPAAQLKTTPTPPPQPTPTPPAQQEWITNLHPIDTTVYHVTTPTPLIDITTGNPTSPAKQFAAGDEFDAAAKTTARGVDYVITQYSLSKNIFNGLPVSVLSVTPAPQPPVPPVPVPTPTPPQDLGWLKTALNGLIDAIKAIIAKLGV